MEKQSHRKPSEFDVEMSQRPCNHQLSNCKQTSRWGQFVARNGKNLSVNGLSDDVGNVAIYGQAKALSQLSTRGFSTTVPPSPPSLHFCMELISFFNLKISIESAEIIYYSFTHLNIHTF